MCRLLPRALVMLLSFTVASAGAQTTEKVSNQRDPRGLCGPLPTGLWKNDTPVIGPVTIPANTPPCSYTALNHTCYIAVDRLRPVTPPTIYMRRNQTLYFVIYDPSPIENITLDLKSATAVVPPDQFSNGFTALTNALSGFQITGIEPTPAAPPPPAAAPEVAPGAAPPPPPPSPEEIAKEIVKKQTALLQQIKQDPLAPAHEALEWIHHALEPVTPVTPLNNASAGNQNTSACTLPDDIKKLWTNTAFWISRIQDQLQNTLQSFGNTQGFQDTINQLDGQIGALPHDLQLTPNIAKLQDNQKTLRDALKTLKTAEQNLTPKLQALIEKLKEIKPAKDPDPNIPLILQATDLHPEDKNY
jgi:hypothetical protein